MRLFDGIRTIHRELTVNEEIEIDSKEIQKEVEAIIAQQTRNLEKLAVEVSSVNISLEEEPESFVPQAKVNEILAGQMAEQVKKQKDQKQQTEEKQI